MHLALSRQIRGNTIHLNCLSRNDQSKATTSNSHRQVDALNAATHSLFHLMHTRKSDQSTKPVPRHLHIASRNEASQDQWHVAETTLLRMPVITLHGQSKARTHNRISASF